MGNYSDYLKQTYGNSKGGSNTTPATTNSNTSKNMYSDYLKQTYGSKTNEIPSLASYTGGNALKTSMVKKYASASQNASETPKIDLAPTNATPTEKVTNETMFNGFSMDDVRTALGENLVPVGDANYEATKNAYLDVNKRMKDAGVNVNDAEKWLEEVYYAPKYQKEADALTESNPLLSGIQNTASALVLNPIESTINTADRIQSAIKGTPMEERTSATQEMRNQASKNMSDKGKFLYGVANSVGDMGVALATAVATGGGSLVSSGLMGVEKASEVMDDAVRRGVTPGKVILEGALSGATTFVTEKIPMDKILKLYSGSLAGSGIKEIAKGIAKSAVSEGTQEVLESIADNIVDRIVAGDKSSIKLEASELEKNGVEPSKALGQAYLNALLNAAMEGIAGALSGGILAGANAMVGAKPTTNVANETETSIPKQVRNEQLPAILPNQEAEIQERIADIARQNVAMQNRIAEEQNANKVPNLADLLAQANNVPQNVEPNVSSGTNEVPAQPIKVENDSKYSTTNIGKDFKDYNDTINSLVNMFARSDEGKQAKADLKSAINEYAETKSPEARAKVEDALAKLESEMKGKTYTTQRSSGKRSDKVKSYSYPTNYGTITENVQSVLDAIDGTNNLGSKIETPRVDNAFAENTVSAESKTSLQNYKEAMQAYKETNDVTYLEDATEFFNQAISELPEEMQNDLLEDFFDSYYDEADVMAEDIGLNPNTTDDADIEPESITMEYDPAVDNLDMHVDTKRSKVSEMSMNTLENSGWFANTQESLDYIANERESGNHNVDVVREKESVETAERMLNEDYQGVIDTIIMSPEISNVQIDASAKIIQDLVAEAERTGDYSRVSSFTRTVIEKVHNAAQGLQALAKYTRTATGTFMKTEQLVQSGIKKFEKSAKGKKVAEKCTKLANALRMQGYDGTRDIPKVEKTHQQIVQGVINEFAKESSSVFADLTSNDYEYVARMVEGGMTAKEISQNIERKLVTGEWGMSTEDMNTIVDLFNKADKAGEFSKEGAEYQLQAYKIAAKYLPNKTFMEKWNAWRYLAMLGNPRTHIRNMFGNFAFGAVTNIKDSIGALLESAYATMSGNDFERTKAITSRIADKDMYSKARTDFEKNAYTLATDEGHKYNMATEIERAQETYNVNTKAGQVLNKINDSNTDALSGEDTFAIRNKYERALVGYLKANGKDASVFDSKNQADIDLLERARAYAINEAKIATFHEDNKVADVLNAWSRTAKESGGLAGKGMEFALEAVMPFKKTPANVLKQGVIEYNPAVQIPKAIIQTIQKGGNPADAINSYAKGLTGAGIVALGILLASKGKLRGGQKDDEDELLGEQEYSYNWDGKSYTIDWLAPAALPLFVGVELYNSYANEDTNIFDALSSISEPIIEMSMLSGLRDTLNSVSSFSKNNNNLAQLGTSLASGYASQGIPTIGGQFARAFAENRKSTRPNAEGMLGTLEYQGRKAANKIPGLTNINEDYVNVWGEKEANTGGNFFGRLAYNMLSPGYYSSTERDNLKAELERLGKDDSVTTNVFPSKADNKYDGERLSTKEYNKYQEKKGQYYTKVANQLIQMPEYKKLTNEDKADVLHDLSLFTNALTKKELFGYDISASSTYKKQYQIYEEQGFKGVIDYLIGKKDKKEDSNSNSSSKKTTTIPGLYGSKK